MPTKSSPADKQSTSRQAARKTVGNGVAPHVREAKPSERTRGGRNSKKSITKKRVTKTSRQRHQKLSVRQLEKLSDEALLEQRICDLPLELESSWIQPKIDKLYRELGKKGIRFKPNVWLSDDWYSPDGIPGIAVPFYLAHPRLKKLERKQMLEVEGGTDRWCMQILRHEAGHALDTAYQLHRRKVYRETFGNYHAPYPDFYHPKPNSKRYVLHLHPWYAQSHPAEDFAETFAVWVMPNSRWRQEYKDWPALKKVQYVDQIMSEIAEKRPKQTSRAKVDPVHRIRKTLREHYDQRHSRYSIDCPNSFDYDLRRLFAEEGTKGKKLKKAASYLQKHRAELTRIVSQYSGEYRYNVNQVLREMIERCRALDLRVDDQERDLKEKVLVMLTAQTMNYLHGGHQPVAL